MSTTAARTMRSARGAILIHVGIAILVLTALSAFVVDFGVMWLARVQAQDAADAGALAGATALALDDNAHFCPGSLPSPACENALAVAQSNDVFGDAATATVKILGVSGPPVCFGKPTCVQVKVYRDGTNGSATLPVYFAPIFGVTSQGIQATATAQAANANYTPCMRPWLIADKWVDHTAPANQFNGADVYTPPPLDFSLGSGWNPDDLGSAITLTQGDPTAPMDGNDYYEMNAASGYPAAITGCADAAQISDAVTTQMPILPDPTPGAVATLLANGPVIVPVALFSPVEWAAVPDRSSGSFTLHIINIMGLKVTSVDSDGTVHGTVADVLGESKPGPFVGINAGLMKFIMLVQ
jgi:Flp pilus assembly protein TadG